jgi:tetratricopeptide (TPR) repeat protein
MPVLVEGISIILRREAIEKKLPGGWAFFKKAVPEATSCFDDRLARVAFMMPQDAQAYIDHLEQFGLVYLADGYARDLAVVSQFEGIIDSCDWLEFRRVPVPGGGEVAVCRYRRGPAEETEDWGQPLEIATPPGWIYEESLSSKSVYVPRSEMDKRLKYLRTENRTEVYLDLETGKEVYTGRPQVPVDSEAGLCNALERIAREVLKFEARLDQARAEQDMDKGEEIYRNLADRLLPEATRILEGPGAEFGFAHYVVGLICRLLAMPDEAEARFRKSLFLKPNVLNTLLELTRCLGEQDRPQEALEFARRAVEVAPESAAAWGNLAMCFIQVKDRIEAKNSIEKALSLDPQDSMTNYIRNHLDNYFKEN